MRLHHVLIALAAGAAAPATSVAQSRFEATLQGGVALPIKHFGDVDLRTGAGFEATVSYRFLEHLAVYAGWDWHRFTTDADDPSFAGPGIDVEETGYAFGLRFERPLAAAGGPLLMIRGGGTLNHIEIEDGDGDVISDSGHGLGWEAGTGLILPLGDRWRLTPTVRIRMLSRDQPIGALVTPVDLRYVAFEVGISRRF